MRQDVKDNQNMQYCYRRKAQDFTNVFGYCARCVQYTRIDFRGSMLLNAATRGQIGRHMLHRAVKSRFEGTQRRKRQAATNNSLDSLDKGRGRE